jgi:hypothetical protein
VTWRWLALRPVAPADAGTAIPVTTRDGRPAGVLAGWGREEQRPDGALRVDHRALAGGADLTWVSLVVLPPAERSPSTTEPSPGRSAGGCAQPWPGLCSTLLVDWGTFGGALTAGATAGRRRGRPVRTGRPPPAPAGAGGLARRHPRAHGPGRHPLRVGEPVALGPLRGPGALTPPGQLSQDKTALKI